MYGFQNCNLGHSWGNVGVNLASRCCAHAVACRQTVEPVPCIIGLWLAMVALLGHVVPMLGLLGRRAYFRHGKFGVPNADLLGMFAKGIIIASIAIH